MNELTGIILVAIHAPCDVVVLLDDEVRLAPPLRVQRRTRACSVRFGYNSPSGKVFVFNPLLAVPSFISSCETKGIRSRTHSGL